MNTRRLWLTTRWGSRTGTGTPWPMRRGLPTAPAQDVAEEPLTSAAKRKRLFVFGASCRPAPSRRRSVAEREAAFSFTERPFFPCPFLGPFFWALFFGPGFFRAPSFRALLSAAEATGEYRQ